MGNSISRRYTLERPYGPPYRSYADSQMRFPIGSSDRFAVSLSQLPNVANENHLLYQLGLARRDIFLDAYLRDRWIHCDLKCTTEPRYLPVSPPAELPSPPPPPPLRHTASDEELERAAIALCCRKRLLPPCAPTPPTKPLVCTKNHCEMLAQKIRDACERKCFWRRFLSGELEDGDGGAGAALRLALEAPPLTCEMPPSAQQCIPSPPCAGQGLPLRPPLFACPHDTQQRTCPITCPGASQVPTTSTNRIGDMQRALDSAWMTGISSVPGNPMCQPSVPYTQTNPSLWVPPQAIPPPPTWSQTIPPYMPCIPPSNTQVPQYQNPVPPLLSPLQQQTTPIQLAPPLQPPAPPPPQINPMQQTCPPAPEQFAEALEVGSAGVGDLSVAVYADGVVEARARGVQAQCGRLIRSMLSRRWRLPSGIRPEALWCFLGSGRLAVVAFPPPPTLIAVLRAMQCLGRPSIVPYAFAQACGVVLT